MSLQLHIKNTVTSSDDVNTRYSRLSNKILTVQNIETKAVKGLKAKS